MKSCKANNFIKYEGKADNPIEGFKHKPGLCSSDHEDIKK